MALVPFVQKEQTIIAATHATFPMNLVVVSEKRFFPLQGSRCLPILKAGANQKSRSTHIHVLPACSKPNGFLDLQNRLDFNKLTNTVEQMGEVQGKHSLLNEFQDVFKGLGCVEGEYSIKLLRLLDRLKETLNDLERNDVIAKVEKPVSLVSNLVIVEKANNWLRLCLDPPDLNEAIKREDFNPQVLRKFQTPLTVVKFSSLLTCQMAQIAIGRIIISMRV